MSATGLGVTFWNDMLTAGTGILVNPPNPTTYPGLGLFEGGANPAGPAVSAHLLFLAQDHDYTITHIFFSANQTGASPVQVRLGIKNAGFPLHDTNDGRKVFTIALDQGQVWDQGTRIPIPGGYGLIGITNVGYGPGTDIGVWASITGEVTD